MRYSDDPGVIDIVLTWADAQPIGYVVRPLAAAKAIRAGRRRVIMFGAPTVSRILLANGWRMEWNGLHKIEHIERI